MPAAVGEGGSDEAVHGLQVLVAELIQLQEAANQAQEELPSPLLEQVPCSEPSDAKVVRKGGLAVAPGARLQWHACLSLS
jgi:hypothetical protein